MRKTGVAIILASAFIAQINPQTENTSPELESRITAVKLFRDQARVSRTVSLNFQKGENQFILTGLPPVLNDWSLKGTLPADFPARILSMEIEKKALLEKKQKKITELESKINDLKEEDQLLLDDLRQLHTQDKFLDGITEFNQHKAAEDLIRGNPQVGTWDSTMNYVTKRRKEISRDRRDLEKKREKLGKEIQKWEYELSQLAGTQYLRKYQDWNKQLLANRASLEIQQFGNMNELYRDKYEYLSSGKLASLETEKRLKLSIYAVNAGKAEFSFSYMVPQANWNMEYDIRASAEKKTVDIGIYGSVFQQSGEDWKEVQLSLSTGAPKSSLNVPGLNPWWLGVYREVSRTESKRSARTSVMADVVSGEIRSAEEENEVNIPGSRISESGPAVEIELPTRQLVESSTRRQKKFILEKPLKNTADLKFFYEITPALDTSSFIKTEITNRTGLPLLPGEAQLFLENEFMGKVTLPFVPDGKTHELVVGQDERLSAKKTLVSRTEDTAGLFGGKRKIRYDFRIDAENNLKKAADVFIADNIPVPSDKQISVQVEKNSHAFYEDPEWKKTVPYAQGIRKWKLNLSPGQKTSITWSVIIEFDAKLNISGL